MDRESKCDRQLRKRRSAQLGEHEGEAKIIKQSWDFQNPTDLVLFVENTELYVHKNILVNSSPVFKVMLECDNFVERRKSRINLPDKKVADIQEMLNFIYPFHCDVTEKNIDVLLKLSREYQIDNIKYPCEEFLLNKLPSMDQLIRAEEFHLPRLKKKCIEHFGDMALYPLEGHKRFEDISDTTLEDISELRFNKMQWYIKRVADLAKQAENPCTSSFSEETDCTHQPKNTNHKYYVCTQCRTDVLCKFIKTESKNFGLDKISKYYSIA